MENLIQNRIRIQDIVNSKNSTSKYSKLRGIYTIIQKKRNFQKL